ncbi:tetratricopeptide repeat protein [Candidatus Tisiphia endosymbiont of Sialis lutaria]|uniref:tetratricopeptide repeat protein n=1 Tax=Candidatus Tisiphia endosymbiont of Sialis lutaria TaxID=2029164 RepID=UPI00312C9328
MGKTQLARMYCYENQNNYKLIWFIDCNLDINQELLKLAKVINSTAKSNLISEDIRLVRKELMNYLSNQDKWLLIFDNLKVNKNKKVKEFVDWEHNGHVIFCSQYSEILSSIVKMTAFGKNDAITLANNILENHNSKLAKFLNKEFAGYPIMIVQGVQLLNNVKGLDKAEYKKKIHQSTDKIKLNITLAIKELKPNAKNLLNKIALINNQGFSKELLKIITDDPNTLDDDLYQLSKFALISNIDSHETNPIFEMHDVIAQKIREISGNRNNKILLEDIILKLPKPKGSQIGHLLRTAKTIPENLEALLKSSKKYNINIYSMLDLRTELFVIYVNTQNIHKERQMIDWLEQKDKKGDFKLWQMSEYQKYCYARYLGLIGVYNRMSLANFEIAISYFTRALNILDTLGKEYVFLKFNLNSHIAGIDISLGNVKVSEENLKKMEVLFTQGVQESDIFIIYYLKAKLFFIKGRYQESLDYINKSIDVVVKNGFNIKDLHLTIPYILKAEILNFLGKYPEAYVQAQQLYDMHKPVKSEEHEIFGRIYTQMAKSELGMGKLDQASEHVNKAIDIFLADERRNPKDADYSEDPSLAASYVIQGDILFAQDNVKAAIESYNKAYTVYHYLYRDNRKNVAHVSYLYNQGAKASCKAKDLSSYKFFGNQQVKEFGINHSNTVSMFKYCKKYNMDLWAKEK